ncbi:hypothetical protein RQP46_010149 [Phenoliferia psychrophenolica]
MPERVKPLPLAFFGGRRIAFRGVSSSNSSDEEPLGAAVSPPRPRSAPKDDLSRLNLTLATFDRPTQRDVRFSFPHTSSELWADSTFLENASPYFKDLFASGFAEATLSHAAPVAPSDPNGKRKRVDEDENGGFSDSDDENDESNPPPKSDASSTPPPYPIHSVVVTAAAYSAYRAVLGFIYTNQIYFKPLRSTKKPSHPSSGASPKSVYRLADFLDMGPLKALALDEIADNHTVANVAEELFGDVSKAYAKVLEVHLKYARKRLERVKETAGMKAVFQRIERREGDAADAEILLKLLR